MPPNANMNRQDEAERQMEDELLQLQETLELQLLVEEVEELERQIEKLKEVLRLAEELEREREDAIRQVKESAEVERRAEEEAKRRAAGVYSLAEKFQCLAGEWLHRLWKWIGLMVEILNIKSSDVHEIFSSSSDM